MNVGDGTPPPAALRTAAWRAAACLRTRCRLLNGTRRYGVSFWDNSLTHVKYPNRRSALPERRTVVIAQVFQIGQSVLMATGDGRELYHLALTHRENDPTAATELFRRAADAAERDGKEDIVAAAMHHLGVLLLESDHEEARACLTRAADLGDTNAMVRLATWTWNSEPEDSLRWLELAERLGDPNGAILAAQMRRNLDRERRAEDRPRTFLDSIRAVQRLLHRRSN